MLERWDGDPVRICRPLKGLEIILEWENIVSEIAVFVGQKRLNISNFIWLNLIDVNMAVLFIIIIYYCKVL